jgi:hypothetical protein
MLEEMSDLLDQHGWKTRVAAAIRIVTSRLHPGDIAINLHRRNRASYTKPYLSSCSLANAR